MPPTSGLQPVHIQLNGALTERIIFFHHLSTFSDQKCFFLSQLFPNPVHMTVKTYDKSDL